MIIGIRSIYAYISSKKQLIIIPFIGGFLGGHTSL